MRAAIVAISFISTALASPNIGKLGFYLSALRNSDSQCKDANNYNNELTILKSYGSDMVKIPSATDCDMLSLIGPSVESNGLELIVNVWADTPSHFQAEKRALSRALPKLSVNDFAEFTLSTGKANTTEILPEQLAGILSNLRTYISTIQDKNNQSYSQVPVGISTSWKTVVDPGYWPVTKVSESLTVNSFPYLDGHQVANSSYHLLNGVEQSLMAYQILKNDTNVPFYVGGTGWPTEGPAVEGAVPNTENAETYWKKSVCALRRLGVNVVMYEAFDEEWRPDHVDRHWGVFKANGQSKYPLSDCLHSEEEESAGRDGGKDGKMKDEEGEE